VIVIAHAYLAELSEPTVLDTTSESLVVFLSAGEDPPDVLKEPDLISLHPAQGDWRFLYLDVGSARAYYTRARG
jgi:hypothetical protein